MVENLSTGGRSLELDRPENIKIAGKKSLTDNCLNDKGAGRAYAV
jgi:hypothetical protein